MSEYSSAEDERRLKKCNQHTNNKHPPKRQRVSASSSGHADPKAFVPSAPVGLSDNSKLLKKHMLPRHVIPSLKSLPQLLIDHQSLRTNIDGTPVCEQQFKALQAGSSPTRASNYKKQCASSSSSSSSSSKPITASTECEDDLARALHMATRAKLPDTRGHWVRTEFETRLHKMATPEFYDVNGISGVTPTQEQLDLMLQRQQYYLPIQPAQLESSLMAESGSFVSQKSNMQYDFPPCMQGDQCVGMTQQLRMQAHPCVFTMVMFEKEYEYFVRTGIPPRVSRPCVMCARSYITSCTVYDRAVRMCGDGLEEGDSVLSVQRTGGVIRQWYQNLRNQEGGYHSIHMLVSNNQPGDPITEPICTPGRCVLICKNSPVLMHTQTNKPRIIIDQSAIVWKGESAPVPSVGENLLSFCGGASKA